MCSCLIIRQENWWYTLTGFDDPEGQCIDKRGDIWITNYEGASVVEYKRGETVPINSIETVQSPVGCSVSPNGDLAVAGGNYPASIWVYKGAAGRPKTYSNVDCEYVWSPGYDGEGNLYVEGDNSAPYICEIPKGASTMKSVQFNVQIYYQGSVMWDGKHIVLTDTKYADTYETGLYRMSEDASGNLTEVGVTVLSDTCDSGYDTVVQPFIVGYRNTPVNKREGVSVVGGNIKCSGRFDYWNYPNGGAPFKYLPSGPGAPSGQSVSLR